MVSIRTSAHPHIYLTLAFASLVTLSSCAQRADGPLVNQLNQGRQQGAWSYVDSAGQPDATGLWRDDLQDGRWTWWWPDGSVRHLGSYARGERTGRWRSWHQTGHLQVVGDYALDRQEGLWQLWFPDGTLRAIGSWRHGIKHGYWTVRDAAGRPLSAGMYCDGLAVGPWVRWVESTAIVEDLGAPPGSSALWSEGNGRRTWTLTGPERLFLAFDQAWVLREGPASVPADSARFAAPLDRLLPTANPPAPLIAEQSMRAAQAPEAPLAILPGLWTKAQESNAGKLINLYRHGETFNAYDNQRANTGDPLGRTLIGKVLPQTRFLGHTGGVIDITRSTRPTVLVVMRGFSGQVCLYCATQTAALSAEASRFTSAGVNLAVIYPGPTESVPAFIAAVQSLQKDPPPMPVGLDVSLLLVRGLAIEANLARPTTLIVKPDGTITWAYVGTSAADRPSVDDILAAVSRSKG